MERASMSENFNGWSQITHVKQLFIFQFFKFFKLLLSYDIILVSGIHHSG